jgi:hypothetical protein
LIIAYTDRRFNMRKIKPFINLSPFVPLSKQPHDAKFDNSFVWRGGRIFERGWCPSLTFTPPSLRKGRGQGDRF